MLQAACFLAVRYLDLVLLQQAEYPPPPVFELGRMDRRLLTNVNGAGRPSRFPLSESLIEIALQNPMREGAGSLPNLPRGVASIESWGRLDENSALASQPWG